MNMFQLFLYLVFFHQKIQEKKKEKLDLNHKLKLDTT